MRFAKGHYIFIGTICFLAAAGAISLYTTEPPATKPQEQQEPVHTIQPEQPENRDQEDVWHDILDTQGDIFTTESKMNELRKKIIPTSSEIEKIKRELRVENGINIFNGPAWYDIIGIWNNYQDKKEKIKNLEALIKEEEEYMQRIGIELMELERQAKSLRLKEDSLRTELAVLKETNQNIAKPKGDLLAIQELQERIFSGAGKIESQSAFSTYIAPTHGEITSPFGYRTHPVMGDRRFHSGVDIGVDTGTPIHASNHGVVILSEYYGGFGNAVILFHGDGAFTLYGHNSELLVSEGDIVRQGQIIALAGSTGLSTGPHCHFSMWQDGKLVDPLDYVQIYEPR